MAPSPADGVTGRVGPTGFNPARRMKKQVRTRVRVLTARLPRRAMAASAGLVVAGGVAQLGALVAAVAVARVLGATSLGIYTAAIAIGSIIVGGLGSGLPALAMREVAAGRAGRRFVRRVLLTQLGMTAGGTVVATGIGMAVVGGARGAWLGFLAGAANIATGQFSLAGGVCSGLGRYRRVGFVQGLAGAGTACITILALWGGAGLPGVIAGLGATSATGAVVLWKHASHRLADDLGHEDLELRRVAPFVLIGLTNAGFFRIDALLLPILSTPSTAGVYASAYRMLGPFSIVDHGLGAVLYTRLAQEGQGREWKRLRRKGVLYYSLAILPVAAVAFAAMPAIIRLVFGSDFLGAITPARLLLLSLVPKALYWPSAFALNAAGREVTVCKVFCVGLIVDVALILVLAPALGAAGAAIAWIVAETVVMVGLSRAVRVDPVDIAASSPPVGEDQLRSGRTPERGAGITPLGPNEGWNEP